MSYVTWDLNNHENSAVKRKSVCTANRFLPRRPVSKKTSQLRGEYYSALLCAQIQVHSFPSLSQSDKTLHYYYFENTPQEKEKKHCK